MSPRIVESEAWKKQEPYISCPDCDPENGTICDSHYIDHVERLEPEPPMEAISRELEAPTSCLCGIMQDGRPIVVGACPVHGALAPSDPTEK